MTNTSQTAGSAENAAPDAPGDHATSSAKTTTGSPIDTPARAEAGAPSLLKPSGPAGVLSRFRRQPPKNEILQQHDLIPDNRLDADATDLLEHEAIAKSVAEIAISAQTPVNIALFGAWGSGKSSIYAMVERHLGNVTGNRVTVARYDAWKYGGKELKRNFVDSIAKDLNLDRDPELGEGLHRPIRRVELDFTGWFSRNVGQLLVGLGLALVATAVFASALAAVTVLTTDTGFRRALGAILPTTGAILGPAILAVLLGPKVLEGVTVTRETPAPEEADQFAGRFKTLIRKARKVDRAVGRVGDRARRRVLARIRTGDGLEQPLEGPERGEAQVLRPTGEVDHRVGSGPAARHGQPEPQQRQLLAHPPHDATPQALRTSATAQR